MGKRGTVLACAALAGDGTSCEKAATTGRYCSGHVRFESRDLEMLKLASEHFRLDLQLFWQRSNLYLLLNTALATVYVSASHPALRPVLAIFGLICSMFWFLVLRGSAYWIDHWRQELEHLDAIASDHRFFTRMSRDTVRKRWLVASEISQWLPAVFAIGWVVLAVSSLL